MYITLSEKEIMNRCGLLAFNRGKQYLQDNKVHSFEDSGEICSATVVGIEDFHVTISREADSFEATCSCPKIASFEKDCQHIAAVLHALLQKQNQGASEELLQLFQQTPARSFTASSFFETRSTLDIQFIFKIMQEDNSARLGLCIIIEHETIMSITDFLTALKEHKNYQQNGTIIFDDRIHCFSKDTAAVLECLLSDMTYEKKNLLLIAPSTWEILFPIIEGKAFAFFVHQETKVNIYEEKKVLPLQFNVRSVAGKVRLEITNMEKLILLPTYGFVIYDNVFYRLQAARMKQLTEVQSLLERYKAITIRDEQLLFFNEKVLPKLQGFGQVKIAEEIRKQFHMQPLKAKLYLDRVNQRLLASLEFHYDYFIIYPSDEQKFENKGLAVRDYEQEERISAFMEEAKFYRTDGGFILHNEALEYTFLYDILPEMEKYVEVYATTAVRNRILPQPIKPKIKIKQHKDRLDWLEFKFEIEGFVEKEVKEILQAIEQKRRYYRLRSGALLSLETREMSEIHEFLQQVPSTETFENQFETSFTDGLKLMDIFKEDESIHRDFSFRNFLQKSLQPDPQALELLKDLHAELRDYQKQGFQWMNTLSDYGFGGVLADDMGLGKTVQSIAFIHSKLTEIRKNDQQIVVICPSAVLYHWKNEFERFSPSASVQIIEGSKEKRRKLLAHIRKFDIIITSYTMIRSDIDWYKKWEFHTMFFDEAQAFKNPRTQTARALKKLHAKNRFALTGTPIENHTDELWSIYHIVFPELFGSYEVFNQLTRKKIARRITPFMLRRIKKDVAIELPEKIEQTEIVELYSEQKKIYAAYLAKLRHENLKHLDKETFRKNRIRILAGLTRLRQLCCHPSLFVEDYQGESAKLIRLLSIIKEAQTTKRRMLIFSQFTSMLQIIARNLAGEGVGFLYLDGETEAEERERLSNRFNQGERDIFLISLKAGGTGLNLIGADTVILYDLWWNPAVEEQAADRAYRIGQKKNVHVIKLLAKGTIEEKMNQLQDKKRDLIKEVIDPDAETVRGLTLEDIQELLE